MKTTGMNVLRIAFWGLVLAVSAVAATAALHISSRGSASAATEESYSRIVTSKKIRCGYVVAPPYTIKDPNTGKLSGVGVDALEAAVEQSGYELIWREEVTWATMIEGLRLGRYDMLCSGAWVNGARAQFADFTTPLFYNVVGAYVRTGDSRFDNDLPLAAKYAAIDQTEVKIATIDGEITSIIANQSFPKAQRLALPQNVDVAQLLLSVVDRKADITFVEPHYASQFMKTRPGVLQNIAEKRPIRIYPWAYMVPKGNHALRDLINAMLLDVVNTDKLERIVAKYDLEPSTIYPLAFPYRPPSSQTHN